MVVFVLSLITLYNMKLIIISGIILFFILTPLAILNDNLDANKAFLFPNPYAEHDDQ